MRKQRPKEKRSIEGAGSLARYALPYEGPVVAQLQSAFIDNWIEVKGDVLHSEEYFPELKEAGPNLAQVFKSSNEGGANSTHLMYLLAITAAKKSIHLSMSYFIPDELAQEAMVAALKRGVAIQIILPGRHIDRGYVRKASRGTWGPLLFKVLATSGR